MIDWTQPIETTETPPRPVTVLFDKDGAFAGAVYIDDDLYTVLGARACRPGYDSISLRNVAPPKPEPVMRNAFIHLYADGGIAVTYVKIKLAPAVEVREIVWMSDGSPVPGEAAVCQYKDHANLQAERDSLKAELERLADEVRRHQDGINIQSDILRKQKPVVDAAVAWVMGTNGLPAYGRVSDAVRAYQNTAPAISKSHEAMMPVKSCKTCRHDKKGGVCAVEGPFGFDCNNDCQDWEVKQ
jgi:hypothetical protein